MKKRKLNYRFHNPNSAATAAGYILKVFIEVNAGKVETAIREAVNVAPSADRGPGCSQGHSA